MPSLAVTAFATVKTEITNAEIFEPKLDRLYMATTAKRDAVLQKAGGIGMREFKERHKTMSKTVAACRPTLTTPSFKTLTRTAHTLPAVFILEKSVRICTDALVEGVAD
jgi:hypothetical protein